MAERCPSRSPVIAGPPDAPFDIPAPDVLARMLLDGLGANQRAENRLVLQEAAATAYLADRERLDALGFASIGDVYTTCLKVSRTIVKERLRLHRAATARPTVRGAFLDGRVSKCQIVVLHSILADPARSEDEIAKWIDLCARKTVRELKTIARNVRRKDLERARASRMGAAPAMESPAAPVAESPPAPAPAPVPTPASTPAPAEGVPECPGDDAGAAPLDPSSDIEPDRAVIRFPAPPVFAAALEEQYELARRHLGYDASKEECWRAIIAEAGFAGRGSATESRMSRNTRPPARIPRIPPHYLGYTFEAGDHAVRLLRCLYEFLESFPEPDLSPSFSRDAARNVLIWFLQISLFRKSIDAFNARLIRSLRETRSLYVLGYDRVEDLIENELRISERSARNMVRMAVAFDSLWPLGLSFESGKIGADAVQRLHRVATIRNCRAWTRRAAQITCLQLARECDLFLALQRIDPSFQHMAPLPSGDLEAILCERLIKRHGWTLGRLKREYRNAGIRVSKGASPDPAETPSLMQKLEILVRLLQLEIWDDPPAVDDPNLDSAERQMFALARRPVVITIAGEVDLIADIRHAIAHFKGKCREKIDTWMAALGILHKARSAWTVVDPEATPARAAILKRDQYRCCVPGCSRRSHLESHHVHWRSRGGRDTIDNQITVCALHHRMIHDGHIRVTGAAPDGLMWELGCRVNDAGGRAMHGDGSHRPLLAYRGQRLREDFREDDEEDR
jgi:hypothetical protein